ncbi:MAG: hypothetical protein ACKOC5_19500 [Chloroflexota bacterium]
MKFDLQIDPPYLNAPGMLGFSPDSRGPVDLDRLGAFVTNPLSLEPRSAAHAARYLDYPGGFLLHTGHPNPGLRTALRRYAPHWERSSVPVIVHLLVERREDANRMAQRLEGLPGVAALELGLPPDLPASGWAAIARELEVELPVILRLPLERAAEIGAALLHSGAADRLAALSLGAPRGLLPVSPPGQGRPVLQSGRLYGPGIFPLALAALPLLHQGGLPLIAGGGVYRPEQAAALFAAGAAAVQLDSLLWRGERVDLENWPR